MSSERLIYSPVGVMRGSVDENGVHILEQAQKSKSDDSSIGVSCCATASLSPNAGLTDQQTENYIPYHHIIWCEASTTDNSLTVLNIIYVNPALQKCQPRNIKIELENSPLINPFGSAGPESTTSIAQRILSLAYSNHKAAPSILVIINPHGGRGKALEIYESQILPILQAAKVTVHLKETTHYQHAVEIAKTLDISQYDIIACCSGDGIPHEIINGFYQRPDKGLEAFEKIAVTQLPCGSGNALSLSTHGSNNAALATFSMLKAKRSKLDLMAVTQGQGLKQVTRLSFLSQCFGIISDADIGTEHLRWMGAVRFDIGVVQRVFSRAKYPCDLYVNYVTNSKAEVDYHYREHSAKASSKTQSPKSLTAQDFDLKYPPLDEKVPDNWTKVSEEISKNLNILYVGKLPYISNDVQFFPAALPNDGSMDMVITDTNSSIWETTKILLSLDKGLHVHNSNVQHSKILAYRLVPRLPDITNHYLSIDGEDFPFEALQVEVMPGVLTCLLPESGFVETSFSK